jgi:hypothetical protein
MDADFSAGLAAVATCALVLVTAVLAAAAIGAFIYAKRTYQAQSAQLDVAREEARRLRAPVFGGQVSLTVPGSKSCTVSLLLLSAERLERLRVVLDGPAVGECPVGFYPGVAGVAPMRSAGDLPPGWKQEHLRPDAVWPDLLPGSRAVWRADPRQDAHDMDSVPAEVHGRVECSGPDGMEWTVPVTFALAAEVQAMLAPRGVSRLRFIE